MEESKMVSIDKLELLQDIGNEICDGCGHDRDCGEEYDECSRIINAAGYLDDFISSEMDNSGQ